MVDGVDKRMAVARLIDESHTSRDYFFLLIVSSLITTIGLLLDNGSVVIGGMLISPLLTPLLALGLSIITNNRESLVRSAGNIAKSVGIVLAVSFATAFIIGSKAQGGYEILQRTRATLPYLYIAILSGVAATYAWVKPKLSASLPGIAVAIALVPPLCVSGIGLAMLQKEIFTGAFQLFMVNIIGIVGAATVMFSLFGFHDMREEEEFQMSQEKARDAGTPQPN